MKNSGFFTVSLCLLSGVLLAGCGEKNKPVQTDNKTEKSVPAKVEDSSAATESASSAKTAVSIENHPGKALHDSNCISCHDSTAYTRKDRKIGDFPKLLAQVKRCDANLGSRLFDEEIDQIADYLNQAYYQYAK